MPSRDEMILHVELLRKIIHDLKLVYDSKGYNHEVTDNIHLTTVYCHQVIDELHQLIGADVTNGGN